MKRKKVEESKDSFKGYSFGEMREMFKPLYESECIPADMPWSVNDGKLYFNRFGPFPFECLKDLCGLILAINKRNANPRLKTVRETYTAIMERAKEGKTTKEDLEILPMVIEEMRRL